jgi:hypothetical protein
VFLSFFVLLSTLLRFNNKIFLAMEYLSVTFNCTLYDISYVCRGSIPETINLQSIYHGPRKSRLCSPKVVRNLVHFKSVQIQV